LGVVSPETENVDYNADTGVVKWNVGNVAAWAGTISPAREVSFQVSFLPSVDKIETTPSLIGEAVLYAKDNFTLATVNDSFSALNTQLSNDPYFKSGADVVVK
jgi:hypothetical protein